jgi:hypothetical protein
MSESENSPYFTGCLRTYPWPSVSFSVIANKPQNDVVYQANIVPCGAEFKGNSTPAYVVLAAGAQSMKPYGHAIIIVIVALTVHIFL